MGAFSDHLSSSPKNLHVLLLYCLLAIQFAYIVLNHFAYRYTADPVLAYLCNCPSALSSAAATTSDQADRFTVSAHKGLKLCTRREDYYDTEDEGDWGWVHDKRTNTGDGRGGKKGKVALLQHASANVQVNGSECVDGMHPDAWHQMKWIGQPANCMVKGKPIERLDDGFNFRRGFALRFVEDVEDKTHLLPWLLASKLDLSRRKRRVYIDLGANRFATSVLWFLRMYPCDFTEIHAFEVNRQAWRPPRRGFDEEGNRLAHASNNSWLVKEKPGIPKWMLDRIHIHYKRVSDRDDEKRGEVNITRFMKEELKLRREDAVVVKMDIEGGEWPVLKAWMEDPEMPSIVDELFVEAHYAHPSMSAFGWDSFAPISRQDAIHLLGDLRWKGFYAHPWP